MSSPALSNTRTLRVTVTGRTRCIVPPQTIPRRVVLVLDPGVEIAISREPNPDLRNAPYQQACAILRAGADVPQFRLAAGQGLWAVSQGTIAEVAVLISYTDAPDPDSGTPDYELLQLCEPKDGYDEAAEECWNYTIEETCDDDFLSASGGI